MATAPSSRGTPASPIAARASSWVNGTRHSDTAFVMGDQLFVGNYAIRLAEPPKKVPA